MKRISVGSATVSSRISLLVLVGVLVVLATVPSWASRDWIRLIGEFLVYAALASLWNLLAGYAGLVSVGQQAFVGLGGYGVFALAVYGGLSPVAAIPLAGLLAGVISVPVAMLTFRLRGAYFAIGTWVVAEVFRLLAAQTPLLGGGSGTSLPARMALGIAATRAAREALVFWLALGLFVLVLGLIILLLRSRYGLALTAIRDNELAARSNGIEVGRIKLVVYVLVAVCTGMVGGWTLLENLRISPDSAFDVNQWTALVIFMTVIGGIGSLEGPIIGCLIFFVLRETLSNLGSVYLMMLGAVAIGVMLKAPKGIWGLVAERTGWQVIPLRRKVRVLT